MKILILFSLMLAYDSIFASTYSKTEKKGWFWYKEEKIRIKDEKTIKNARTTHREILRKQGQKWEEAVSKAILRPNSENIREYIVQTEKITNQAENFSAAFEKYLWVNPKYDRSINNPTSTLAILAKNKEDQKSKDKKLKMISKEYGIVFFFDSKCLTCKYFAPILKRVAQKYSFEVLPISIDGQGLKEYPKFKSNFYLADKLNLNITPSTYLLNPDTDQIAPISFGMASSDELKERILFAKRSLDEL